MERMPLVASHEQQNPFGQLERIGRMSVAAGRAAANRAVHFARRRQLSFERMPSTRRTRHPSTEEERQQPAAADMPAPLRRSNSDPEVTNVSDQLQAIPRSHTEAEMGSGHHGSTSLPSSPQGQELGQQHSVTVDNSDKVETDDEDIAVDYSEGFGELWADRSRRIAEASPFSCIPGWGLSAFIVKSNDELLQEQFAVSLVSEFDRIFKFAKLPLRLQPYRIIATGPAAGLIEVVPDAKSLDSIKKEMGSNYFSLADFFRRRYGGASTVAFHRARRNFVQSLAAYSVVSYLLQLKDRHNGNILLQADGSLVHIDFGFLLSNSPGQNLGFEAAPFKLTSEWVDLIGGVGSAWFRYFSTLVVRGFQEARRHMDKLLLIVRATYLGVGGKLPCFHAGEATVEAMRQRFHPEMSNQRYARFAAELIDGSIDNCECDI